MDINTSPTVKKGWVSLQRTFLQLSILTIGLLLIGLCGSASARLIESTSPYLSGDTFRFMCDYHFDEVTTAFDPLEVKAGDCIFVKTDMLGAYFETKHPYIQFPYIIISHNADHPAPGPGEAFLDDPKIVAWFAQNVEMTHPKLHPIPIGLENPMFGKNVGLIAKHQKAIGTTPKTQVLYMNFTISNSPKERQAAYNHFHDKPYCLYSSVKPWEQYLLDLLRTQFVVSPRGNGLDCLRTWEALYMGAFPIVQTSHMDPLFEGLPVVIVNNWEEINASFLQRKYEKLTSTHYSLEKLYDPYWENKIRFYKEIAKSR